jgi:tetrahydromethanopterin S-methyltransferase subunit B
MDIESRVGALESAVGDIRMALARIEERLSTLATREQVAELRGSLESQIGQLRGAVSTLPTAWVMVTAIVAGQVALAGLIAAVTFGLAHLMGHI